MKLPVLEANCEEFVVGPAIRRQAPIVKQPSKIHREESVDGVTVNDTLMDETPKDQPAAARKETISLLLDRSRKLRDAMINSILDTEDTIKTAETLYDSTKISRFHK